MFDDLLEEKISLESIEGYKFLGKKVGELLNDKDLERLLGLGLRDPFYALQINQVRLLARQNGKELTSEINYTDTMDIFLNGTTKFPYDQSVVYTSNYFTARYHFATKEVQEKIIDDLTSDVHEDTPYADSILKAILKSHNDSTVTKPNYEAGQH